VSFALLHLTARQERIIRERFGINCIPKTLKEIAEKFNRSVECIRHIEAKALRRLRMFLHHPRKRLQVDFAGANFGFHAPPATPPKPRMPHRWQQYWRLEEVILEMKNAGATPRQIWLRLRRDYRAASWLNKKLHISAYVPSKADIALFVGRAGD